MKLLFPHIKSHLKLILLTLLLVTAGQIFVFLDPLIFKYIIDDYATNFQNYAFNEFFGGVVFFLALSILSKFAASITKNLQTHLTNVIALKVGNQIYNIGLTRALKLPYTIFEDQHSGQTISRLAKAKSDVEKLITLSINTFFSAVVGFIFVSIYSCTVHWTIAPTFILALPLLSYLSFRLTKKIKSFQSSISDEATLLASSTTDSLRNIELIKSLGLSEQEITRFISSSDKILKLELNKGKYVRSLIFIQGAITNIVRALILLLMFFLIYIQQITFGQFFALYVYSFFLFRPLQELGNIMSIYRETEVSLKHYQDILDTPVEIEASNPLAISKLNSLEFNNVSFQYHSALSPSLKNISFKSNLGETIAFVGPSGAGKTTLVKLLVGLYQPLTGNISYNNLPADQINLLHLRNQIGYVTQDSHLFAGTIKDNLLFVKLNATDQECLEALRQAACNSLLDRAEKGLDNLIGEGGIKLSGGEKQRLSIARALLRQPTLLIFDEATSSLDSLTEKDVSQTVQNISKLKKHLTILIAHRLSTIMHADRIFVLERGEIIESGKHEELLKVRGLYFAMWRQQIGEGQMSEVF